MFHFGILSLTTISCGGSSYNKSDDTGSYYYDSGSYYYDTGYTYTEPSSEDTGNPQPDYSITLTADEISRLPYDLQDQLNAGELKAYRVNVSFHISALYPQEAQEALFISAAFADGAEDPTEGAMAIGIDGWCCDVPKWDMIDDGMANNSVDDWTTCDDVRKEYYCTALGQQDCYRWGNPDDFLDAGTGIKGYSVLGQEFPCDTAQSEFYNFVTTVNSTLNSQLLDAGSSATVSDIKDGLGAFVNTMTAPEMTGLILVDDNSNIDYFAIESLDLAYGAEIFQFSFVEQGLPQPYVMGSGYLDLSIGTMAYSLLNDQILPYLGIQETIASFVANTVAEKACSIVSYGTSTCEDRVRDAINDKIDPMLTTQAERVVVNIGDVQFDTFTGTGGSFTATSSYDSSLSVSLTYTVQGQ